MKLEEYHMEVSAGVVVTILPKVRKQLRAREQKSLLADTSNDCSPTAMMLRTLYFGRHVLKESIILR